MLCIICNYEKVQFFSPKELNSTKCSHSACLECWLEWFRRKEIFSCPFCRDSIEKNLFSQKFHEQVSELEQFVEEEEEEEERLVFLSLFRIVVERIENRNECGCPLCQSLNEIFFREAIRQYNTRYTEIQILTQMLRTFDMLRTLDIMRTRNNTSLRSVSSPDPSANYQQIIHSDRDYNLENNTQEDEYQNIEKVTYSSNKKYIKNNNRQPKHMKFPKRKIARHFR